MFPHMPKEELIKEYHASNNDINRTISSILGDSDNNSEMKTCFSSGVRTTSNISTIQTYIYCVVL